LSVINVFPWYEMLRLKLLGAKQSVHQIHAQKQGEYTDHDVFHEFLLALLQSVAGAGVRCREDEEQQGESDH